MTTDTQQPAAELPQPAAPTAPESEKTFLVTWILSLLLGFLAVDRFYLGKVGTGILKLVTNKPDRRYQQALLATITEA